MNQTKNKNKVDNLLNFILLAIDNDQPTKNKSLPLLDCYIKKISQNTYSIIDKSLKNCIKCYFLNSPNQNLSTLDKENVCQIQIAKYSFDYLLAPKSGELQSLLILIIETFSISSILSPITFKPNSIIDINKNEIIQSKKREKIDILIKKILNEHFSAFSNYDISANIFLNNKIIKQFDKPQNIFDIIKELYNIEQKSNGVLLKSHIEIKEIDDYLYDYYFDSEFTDNVKKIKEVNWKTLFKSMPSINKESNCFVPSKVDIRNFNRPTVFENIKNSFLNRKLKRYIFKDDDYEMPKKIQSLISQYSNVQTNLGISVIEKYNLYKKYTSLREDNK